VSFDSEKFKHLVQYVCWRCDDPAELGATKLNKVLWRADTQAYYLRGESITGARYVKRQFGPVPSAMVQTLRDLESEGALAIREEDYFGNAKKEFFALKRPDLSLFSAEEISLVDQSIEYVCRRHTARSISAETHDDIWNLAKIGEEIPYYTVFASRLGEVTEDDIAWARTQIEELAA
jgi:hypothetical protein